MEKKNHSRLNICSKKRPLLYVKSSSVFIQYDTIYIYIINSIKGILILKRLLDITVMYFQYLIRQFQLVLEYMPYTTVMLQLTKEKANTSGLIIIISCSPWLVMVCWRFRPINKLARSWTCWFQPCQPL